MANNTLLGYMYYTKKQNDRFLFGQSLVRHHYSLNHTIKVSCLTKGYAISHKQRGDKQKKYETGYKLTASELSLKHVKTKVYKKKIQCACHLFHVNTPNKIHLTHTHAHTHTHTCAHTHTQTLTHTTKQNQTKTIQMKQKQHSNHAQEPYTEIKVLCLEDPSGDTHSISFCTRK